MNFIETAGFARDAQSSKGFEALFLFEAPAATPIKSLFTRTSLRLSLLSSLRLDPEGMRLTLGYQLVITA